MSRNNKSCDLFNAINADVDLGWHLLDCLLRCSTFIERALFDLLTLHIARHYSP